MYKRQVLTSATDRFEIEITGRGGHSSMPQECIDPIVTGAAGDLDLKTVRGRGENAAAHAEAARGQRACEMQTEHLVHTLQRCV